jgi:hypothetical protein
LALASIALGGCFFGGEAEPQAEKPFDEYQPRAAAPSGEGEPSAEPGRAAEQPPAEEEHPLANANPPAFGPAEGVPSMEVPAAPSQESQPSAEPEQPEQSAESAGRPPRAPLALPQSREPPPVISGEPPSEPPPLGEEPPPAKTFNPPAHKPMFGKVPFGHGEVEQPAEPNIDNLFGGEAELPATPPVVDAGVAMRDFFALLREGETAEADQFILMPSNPAKRELARKQVAQMGARLADGSMKIETLLTRRQGDWALVAVHITMNRGGKTSERVSNQFMYNLEGQWKLVPETIRDDPAVAPLLNQDFQALKNWYQSNKPALEKQYL